MYASGLKELGYASAETARAKGVAVATHPAAVRAGARRRSSRVAACILCVVGRSTTSLFRETMSFRRG